MEDEDDEYEGDEMASDELLLLLLSLEFHVDDNLFLLGSFLARSRADFTLSKVHTL